MKLVSAELAMLYHLKCRKVSGHLTRQKMNYFWENIAQCGNIQKCLFKIKWNLVDKIAQVVDSIDTDNSSISETAAMDADVAFEGQLLTRLEPSTQDEVHDIIVKSLSNSCELHPLKQML